MRNKYLALMVLLPCLHVSYALSIDAVEGTTTEVIVTGEIQEDPPCEINGGDEKTVSFGKVNPSKIEAGEYLKNVNLDVICEPDVISTGRTFTFTLGGTVADFDTGNKTIIKVNNVDNLGVKLFKDGNELALDHAENFDATSGVINLDALLVKKKDETVSAGNFYATAVIQIDIQ
ncbi:MULTISPECIES: fimbrial protein [Cedecea]|jgi:type 1 fimbria pilin|uniref:Fimbrial-type adhesion domain-containing protein n=1 Tax=Cedecea neteri TaxID=158822 RepID=A0A089Q546_9ENTR|nr:MULTISPECIES: fimbrial protein [Cedecea]AIR05574.1 hypothetical protein JT31_13425 [Cedecea neteri]NWC64461.1 fimbrial protein [Cedecea sp. P7760]